MNLAKLLQTDLAEMGLIDIKLTEQAILIGKLPANIPDNFHGQIPPIGFLAHLDTVNVHMSPVVKPHIVNDYDGRDILLNQEQDIIFVAFVPDEEIGLLGAKAMNLSDFPVAFAYTIDCCELGEVVYETFNAGSAVINIKGVTAHPMSAKGVLVNPSLVVNDIINHFDKQDTPEYTDGKMGFFLITGIISNPNTAVLNINIRDHDKNLYKARKTYIADLIKLMAAHYPKAHIFCKIQDDYSNIADSLTDANKQCIEFIYKAMERLDITPKTLAMRGGTDGSFLSAQGIPTPNFFTGAHNFHSNFEFLPINSFEKSCLMVLEIAQLVSERA